MKSQEFEVIIPHTIGKKFRMVMRRDIDMQLPTHVRNVISDWLKDLSDNCRMECFMLHDVWLMRHHLIVSQNASWHLVIHKTPIDDYYYATIIGPFTTSQIIQIQTDILARAAGDIIFNTPSSSDDLEIRTRDYRGVIG